jgi:formylglycine-generating enzyme required for sulfatase activity
MYKHSTIKLSALIFILITLSGCDKTETTDKAIISADSQSYSVIQDKLTNDALAPQLIIVPAGSNTLGDITGSGIKNELPTYQVTIDKPFAIGKFEVTFDEYDLFCEATKHKKTDDEGWGRGKLPVINVTWDDAYSYVKWLSKQTGKKYFLPSEAQWEYSARAGTQTNYWWGNDPGDKNAQCVTCAAKNRCIDCKDVPLIDDGTAPVGSFKANPFGLYDVHGNVMEWVADCDFKTNPNKPSNGTPRRNGDCSKHIMKDGSWWNNVNFIRASVRGSAFDGKEYKSFHVGFRVAREID